MSVVVKVVHRVGEENRSSNLEVSSSDRLAAASEVIAAFPKAIAFRFVNPRCWTTYYIRGKKYTREEVADMPDKNLMAKSMLLNGIGTVVEYDGQYYTVRPGDEILRESD